MNLAASIHFYNLFNKKKVFINDYNKCISTNSNNVKETNKNHEYIEINDDDWAMVQEKSIILYANLFKILYYQ